VCNILSSVKSSEARSLPGARPETAETAADLAGALHEVSNALTVVLGWLDSAYSTLPPGEEREAVEIARSHARLGHHVARHAIGAETGREQSERSARSMARGAVVGVSKEAKRRSLLVEINDRGAGGTLIQYVDAVQQILLNLLLNAIEFSPPSSTIVLTLRSENGYVVFSVSDQGPGIEPERALTILSSATSTRPGGAGVGLRYSSALARSYGGELVLERASPGACFALRWPSLEAPSSARNAPILAPTLRGTRLLLVEDDASICSLIEVVLEARGAEVVTVRNAAEFVRIAARERFDAALIDLSPIADDVAGALATLNGEGRSVPIILISGVASGVPAEAAGQVAAWVRKPFEMAEVVDALHRVIAPVSS